MTVKFTFEDVGKSYFGRVYRPIAKVSFYSSLNKTWTDTWMIVDTGADFTILPKYLSENLGISLEKDCIKDSTFGVGGTQTIYLCKQKIAVKLGEVKRSIPLAFFDSNSVPPLLGRLGFLETFNTEFLKSRQVVFH